MKPTTCMYALLTSLALVFFIATLDPILIPIACVTASLCDDSIEFWKEQG